MSTSSLTQVLEHGHPTPLGEEDHTYTVSMADYKLSELFLEKMKLEVKLMRKFEDLDMENYMKKTVANGTTPGVYGGGSTDFAVLSYLLNTSIVRLDLYNPHKTHVFWGNKKGTIKILNEEDLATFMKSASENGEPVIVVEFDGHSHFHGYESGRSLQPEHPIWLMTAMKKLRRRAGVR